MKNIKYELFNFRKNLSLEQEEVSVILENHIKIVSIGLDVVV